MKTKKVLSMFSILLLGMFFASVSSQAQTEVKVEKDAKEIKIRIEKDNNGNTFVIDTVITDLEGFDFKAFKEKYGVDLKINDCHPNKKIECIEGAKKIEVFVEGEGEAIEGGEVEMNVFITDDGETKTIKTKKGSHVIKLDCKGEKDCENHIVIKKIDGKEGETMIFMTDEMEVTEGQEGMKVIDVREANGEIIITSKIMIIDLKADDDDVIESGLKDELAIEEADKLEVSDLTFYPNPTSGLIKFSFDTESTNPVAVNVFDMSGKKVYTETVTDFKGKYEREIDLSNMKKGIYFLKITQNNKTVSKKIILN